MISRRSFMASALIGGLPAGFAFADDYPSKVVRIIVSTGAGTGTDTSARQLAGLLSRAWNQPFIVENVNGAGGVIATSQVFRNPADGYNLLFTYASHYSNQWVTKTPYDAVADFEPIARVANTALLLIVPATSPLRTVADVIAAAKKEPGSLTYGTAGNGTTGHMAGALFANMAGVRLKHVPYKTPGQSVLDVAGGVLDMAFGGPASVLPLLAAGRVRVIAATSMQRLSFLPDVPTIHEAGLSGYENSSPVWLLVKAGTPRAIIDKLSGEVTRAAGTSEFKEAANRVGLNVDIQPAAVERANAHAELEKWRKLVALTATE